VIGAEVRSVGYCAMILDPELLAPRHGDPPGGGNRHASRSSLGADADLFMLHIYAALAEKERAPIAGRTRLALAQRTAEGALPRNRTDLAEAQAKAHEANRGAAETLVAKVLPIMRQIRAAGVSGRQNIANALVCALPAAARGTTARCAIRWRGGDTIPTADAARLG
jgi:hypothetical protein